MIIILFIACLTILQVQSQLLSRWKNKNAYIPREDSSLIHQDVDIDDEIDEPKRKSDDWDDVEDDNDDDIDVVPNRPIVRQYDDSDDDEIVSYRPTKKITLGNNSLTETGTRILQPLQTRLYFVDAWPTISVRMMKNFTSPTPKRLSSRSKFTWRDYFPPAKFVSRHNDPSNRSFEVTKATQFTTRNLDGVHEFHLGSLKEYAKANHKLAKQHPNSYIAYDKDDTVLRLVNRPTDTPEWYSARREPPEPPIVNYTYKLRISTKLLRTGTSSTTTAETTSKSKPKWLCYTCGMNETTFGSPVCYDTFERDDQRTSYKRRNFKTKCTGKNTYKGGCFKRFLDVGTVYNERGCRNWPPTMGNSFASKRFMKLEYVLKHDLDACVASPHAVLVPFSRPIHLYARFHVCVCQGRYCNAVETNIPKSALIKVLTSFVLVVILL